MKTRTQALSTIPSQNQMSFRPLADGKNVFISQLLGCEVKNIQVICLLLVSLCLVLTLIFATDMVALYGWSAFFALSAVCLTYCGLRDLLRKLSED